MREQVVLQHRSHLLEFASQAARQDAQKVGVEGRPVGERFLLITPSTWTQYQRPKKPGSIGLIDYDSPLPQNLCVSETGVITLTEEASDLLIEALLDLWAERRQEGQWQLTRASVSAHVKAGTKINELIVLLTKRCTRRVPPLLELALRNWAGRAKAVELERLAVLHCKNSSVLDAILDSERLRPYLRGRLGEDMLLFDSEQVEEVQEILHWAGLKSTTLSLRS